MTLYMKLGGRKAIMRAMPRLQARLEQDPCFDLAGFRQEFERSDDLTEFLTFLFGGAPFYDGKPVSALLSPICTCVDVYERFVDHLVAVFFGGNALAADEADLRALMQRLQPQVLDPKPAAPVLVYSVDPDRLSA
ncbi:globin family protein [Roseibium sp. M-1]